MLLALISLGAAASTSERIENAARDGRTERAWELCSAEDAAEALKDAATRSICADVHLRLIEAAASPAPPSKAQLDGHSRRWTGTPAAIESRERAGKMALVAAAASAEAVIKVGQEYAGTAAGREAVDRLWAAALNEATPDAMRNFYESWPDAPQVDTAKRKELELAWAAAEAVDTPEAWRRLVAEYPAHPRKGEAYQRELSQAFQRALLQNTPEGWQNLLAAYPTHPQRLEAEVGMKNASFTRAAASGADALLTFALTWPDDPRSTSILNQIASETQVVAWVGSEPMLVALQGSVVSTKLERITIVTPLKLAGARLVDASGIELSGQVWTEEGGMRIVRLEQVPVEGASLSVVVGMDTWSLAFPVLVSDKAPAGPLVAATQEP